MQGTRGKCQTLPTDWKFVDAERRPSVRRWTSGSLATVKQKYVEYWSKRRTDSSIWEPPFTRTAGQRTISIAMTTMAVTRRDGTMIAGILLISTLTLLWTWLAYTERRIQAFENYLKGLFGSLEREGKIHDQALSTVTTLEGQQEPLLTRINRCTLVCKFGHVTQHGHSLQDCLCTFEDGLRLGGLKKKWITNVKERTDHPVQDLLTTTGVSGWPCQLSLLSTCFPQRPVQVKGWVHKWAMNKWQWVSHFSTIKPWTHLITDKFLSL